MLTANEQRYRVCRRIWGDIVKRSGDTFSKRMAEEIAERARRVYGEVCWVEPVEDSPDAQGPHPEEDGDA